MTNNRIDGDHVVRLLGAITGALTLCATAIAGPLLDLSRSGVSYGRVAGGVDFVQPVHHLDRSRAGEPRRRQDADQVEPHGLLVPRLHEHANGHVAGLPL